MATTNLKTASDEELQAEIAARASAQAKTEAAAELETLKPFADMGYGTQAVVDQVQTLKGLLATSTDMPWFTYLQAAVVGMESLNNTVGGKIQYLNSVLNPPPTEEASATSPIDGDEL